MHDLTNFTVLVTRPAPQGLILCQAIEALNGMAIFLPAIEFAPPPDPAQFEEIIKKIEEQNWVVFISPQAVSASITLIKRYFPVWPSSVKIAAIGEGTASALKQAGLTVDLQPEKAWNSEGLLALPAFQSVANQNIAIVRGVGGREYVDRVLTDRGATVSAIIAYQRVLPNVDTQQCLVQLEKNEIDVIICTSFEAVSNLKILIGEKRWPYLTSLPLIVMSERIKALAETLGFQTIWITREASQAAILTLLLTIKQEKENDQSN